MRARSTSVAAILLLAAACNRSEAPAEELEEAAEEVVAAVESEIASAPGDYAPRDDCLELPGGGPFLRELEAAVAARDADALAALAAQDIKLDFGGGTGVPELRRRLAEPDGALWEELAELADLGCAANSQGGLTLPWYFEQQVPVADPFGGFIALGEGVPLRAAPAADAPVRARIDWAAVELLPEEGEHEGFRHVSVVRPPRSGLTGDTALRELPLTGYVAEDRLRSLVDYRLTAATRNGRWRIISLVAGD